MSTQASVSTSKTTTVAVGGATLELGADGSISFAHRAHRVAGARAWATIAIGGQTRTVPLAAGTATIDVVGGRERVVVRAEHDGFASEWWITVDPGDPVVDIGAAIIGRGNDARVIELRALEIPIAGTALAREVAGARFWIVPSCAWDRPGTRPLASAPTPEDCASVAMDIGAAFAPSGAAITLAHRWPTRWINRIEADGEHLRVRSEVGAALPPHGTLRADALWLDLERGVIDALAALGARQPGRRLAQESAEHWGWNSWDYWLDKVTHERVVEAARTMKATPWMRERLRYVAVDDGWQDGDGDWNANAKFGDMAKLAADITAEGFLPGIWSAPFIAMRHSELLKRRPELALRTTAGELYSPWKLGGCEPPWGDRCYLDPTHPGTREHIFELYRKLHRWGFRYFKTDFLTNSIAWAFPGEQEKHRDLVRVHDPGMGLLAAHRACMEAIRAAIGPDSFWLGCGTHFATGAGLMDATRISADMRVHYPNLLYCVKSAIFHFHLHGGAFIVDPDFSVFRGIDTADLAKLDLPIAPKKPYDRHKPESGQLFDLAEARLWAACVAMTGGAVMLSDRLDGLNEAGLTVARTLLEHGGGPAALPLDAFSSLPRVWRKRHRGATYLMAVNWDDAPAEIEMPAGLLSDGTALTDLWTGERSVHRAGARVTLAAHGHRWLKSG